MGSLRARSDSCTNAAARRAVELDPSLAEGYSALAMALMLWERDYTAAHEGVPPLHRVESPLHAGPMLVRVLRPTVRHGRLDEGVAEARQALEADPLSAYATSLLGLALGVAGQTAEGIEAARLGSHRDPDALYTRWVHGMVAHWHGAFEEAVSAFSAAAAVSGRHSFALAHCAVAYADWGKVSDARAMHEEVRTLSERRYVPRITLALSAAAVGEQDLAMDLVRQACDEREPYLIIIARSLPDARRLRDDPRFADVLRRLAYPGLV